MKKTGGRKSRDTLPLNQIQGPESVKMESGSNSVANYADPQTWFKYSIPIWFVAQMMHCLMTHRLSSRALSWTVPNQL